LVWSITNGVRYDQMPPDQQAMFSKLVPEYRGLVTGDPVQSIRDRWETMRHKMPLLPSLDAAVDKLGAVGTTIHSLEQAQQATIANASNFEQSKATLAPQTIMSPAPVAAKSWSMLNDRVYAKIKLPRNYHGIGSVVALLVRVLPATTTAPAERRPGKGSAREFDTVASAYSDSAGATAGADFNNSLGMPAQNGVQPLTFGPAPGTVTVGPATTGNDTSSDGPPPKKLGDDYLNNGIKWWNDFWGNSTSSNANGGTNSGTGPTSNGPGVTFTGNDPGEDKGGPYVFYPTYGK
jgi:hypothetical protein